MATRTLRSGADSPAPSEVDSVGRVGYDIAGLDRLVHVSLSDRSGNLLLVPKTSALRVALPDVKRAEAAPQEG